MSNVIDIVPHQASNAVLEMISEIADSIKSPDKYSHSDAMIAYTILLESAFSCYQEEMGDERTLVDWIKDWTSATEETPNE